MNSTPRIIDLAFAAGKKRQSPRTGFVHLYQGSDASDTIPIYENFCFALSLLSQKKAETVLEAKNLLQRLLAFQTSEGNFPIYLHDYPKCYDIYAGLRVAAILRRILQQFFPVLGPELKDKMETALQLIFDFYSDKTLSPLWAHRYAALQDLPLPVIETASFSPTEWWEYWISLPSPTCDFYHVGLGAALLPAPQDFFEPAPQLIEWACAAAVGNFPQRLLKDHPWQVQLAALDKIELSDLKNEPFVHLRDRFLWKEETLHSLTLCEPIVDLPTVFEFGRDDLMEVELYCDASPDVQIYVDGLKATTFNLENVVTISTASMVITIGFEIVRGEGEFCGHVFRSNRPGQIATVGPLQYEAFDWKIALRTLRRSEECSVKVHFSCIPLVISEQSTSSTH